MAEEEEVQEGSSNKLFIMIIIVLLVLLLAVGGLFVWKVFLTGDEQTAPAEAAKEIVETTILSEEIAVADKAEIFFPLNPFIVNLRGTGLKRYLKATIELEVDSDALKKELKTRTPQIRDAIVFVLTNKTYEDITTNEGKLQLKHELTARINNSLSNGVIRMLYFTDFIVQ
ncbi:flagellar FliL protein [Candidatus Magnetomoraceae bacterium gMMP-15]